MGAIARWDLFHNLSTLQEQVNRIFEGSLPSRSDQSALTIWAPLSIFTRRRTSWC